MDFYIYLIVGFLGAAFGSFAGAQVWRLRAKQLVADKKDGQKVSASELKKLKALVGKKFTKDRSRCLSCQHELRWYDLLPIISWLSVAGKCRYCRKPIGWTEILLEVGLAALFVVSLLVWPVPIDNYLEIIKLVLWLSSLVVLAVLFVYDARWMLLPDVANISFVALGTIYAGISLIGSGDLAGDLWSLLGAGLILSGLYLLIYVVSRGKWIGFGDVKLGLGMALFLLDWRLAFAALFAANLIGTIMVLPAMITGKIRRDMKLPFGPLLIAGFLLAWYFAPLIIQWYQSMIFI
ncbi:hypothetical protein CR969_02265 [Candidatus Saccharibacteria bacterium]|nr:MAG: hypothetical protein CR969_02265 [Candidatus Saccharibacteria bacterium]